MLVGLHCSSFVKLRHVSTGFHSGLSIRLYLTIAPSVFDTTRISNSLSFPATLLSCRSFLRNICPNQSVFLFFIILSITLSPPIIVNTSSFLTPSVHFTLISLRHNHNFKMSRYVLLFFHGLLYRYYFYNII